LTSTDVKNIQCDVEVQAYDEEGNQRLCGGDTFLARLVGITTVDANVEDKGDGTYDITYSTTTAGIYNLYISNGEITSAFSCLDETEL
jgi:hypothetical protein